MPACGNDACGAADAPWVNLETGAAACSAACARALAVGPSGEAVPGRVIRVRPKPASGGGPVLDESWKLENAKDHFDYLKRVVNKDFRLGSDRLLAAVSARDHLTYIERMWEVTESDDARARWLEEFEWDEVTAKAEAKRDKYAHNRRAEEAEEVWRDVAARLGVLHANVLSKGAIGGGTERAKTQVAAHALATQPAIPGAAARSPACALAVGRGRWTRVDGRLVWEDSSDDDDDGAVPPAKRARVPAPAAPEAPPPALADLALRMDQSQLTREQQVAFLALVDRELRDVLPAGLLQDIVDAVPPSDEVLDLIEGAKVRRSLTFDIEEMGLLALPKEVLELTWLEQLYLPNNRLRKLPPDISKLTNLKQLWLHHNLLEELPPAIGDLTSLRSLYLGHNLLWTLPNTLSKLTSLARLDLQHNRLEELPAEIGNLAALKELDLRGNFLAELPPEIGNLTALQWLYLGENSLRTLPDALGNLTPLFVLDLQGNQLEVLPDTLGNLTTMFRLNLRDNQLRTLPDTLGNLTRLARLDLRGNRALTLPDTLRNLTALDVLVDEVTPA